MKKNKKIVKIQKINKNKILGINNTYKNKIFALYGIKPNKNLSVKNCLNKNIIEQKMILNIQEKYYAHLEQSIIKSYTKQLNQKTYKGMRIKNKLPLRGQRTHTNAKTAKKLLTKIKI